MNPDVFQVGLSRDFLTADGKLVYRDIGLGLLDRHSTIHHHFLKEHQPVVAAEQLRDLDAIISLTPKYTADSFVGVERLIAIARFGVGYDMVDVKACTDADVLLYITTGAVNHSVAEATLAWMLALSHRMFDKDRLVREGRWAERGNYMGTELRGHTLGIVGLGGIGGRLIEMLRGFGMNRPLAFDPFLKPERAAELGVEPVALDRLMRESDFISVNCPLNDQTHDLIRHEQIALMKPTAFLINTARGGIVNESALFDALKHKRIAGAASDVYGKEPAGKEHPFAQLENIILAPHCIAWTDELFSEIGMMAAKAVMEIAHGRVPSVGVINREVLKRPRFQRKLARWKGA